MDANDPTVIERAHPRRSRWSLERWPLRWKVTATLVVPMALAASIGAVRIENELANASELSVASGNAAIVVPAVDFVDRLNQLASVTPGGPIEQSLARFDESAAALTTLVRSADLDSTVTADLATASVTAKTVRDELAAGAPASIVLADRMDSVASDVASAVTTSTAIVDDSSVRPIADRLTAALSAQRELITQRVLVATPDFAISSQLRARAAEAAGAETAAIERLYELAPDANAILLRGQSEVRRDAYTQPLDQPVASVEFDTAMQSSVERYAALTRQLAGDLETTIEARATSARSAALRDTAIILGSVLAALVFALGVGRSLIRSVAKLREGALQVARVQLPEEIEQLSKGAGVPEITALPVDTDEELGQLARAIDDIHLQAVRLASEHGVQIQIGDMFETLSRRSRSLVEEQLVLIETLEHDEDDPARLDHLFRLDHLATRMRRNGDNLLVLADTVDRHRRLEPVPIPEMLRAAISEVEDYRRVTLGPVVDGAVVGAAAADIGHMLAELLDNALQYSPPDSPVWVTVSRAVDAGVLVEIADRGLGMPADDMREANERLALGGEVTSDTAKRMGLFVVGRLGRRHGATVRLRTPAGSADQSGVTVSVHLPGELLSLRNDVHPSVGPAGDAGAVGTAVVVQPIPLRPVDRGNGLSPSRPVVAPVPHLTAVQSAPPAPQAGRTPLGLPQRSPGASGVTAAPQPPAQRAESAAEPTPEPPQPTPPVEPAWPAPESDDGSIYARMTSEWMNPSVPPAPPKPAPPKPPPPSVVALPGQPGPDPQRRTKSGLPIRERGARMIPDAHDPAGSADGADGAADASAETGTETRNDPEAIRAVLSRQLTGVRRGRAETDEANRRGDEQE